eukprot:1155928-Pelagomonas_calceolata.AAC.5
MNTTLHVQSFHANRTEQAVPGTTTARPLNHDPPQSLSTLLASTTLSSHHPAQPSPHLLLHHHHHIAADLLYPSSRLHPHPLLHFRHAIMAALGLLLLLPLSLFHIIQCSQAPTFLPLPHLLLHYRHQVMASLGLLLLLNLPLLQVLELVAQGRQVSIHLLKQGHAQEHMHSQRVHEAYMAVK